MKKIFLVGFAIGFLMFGIVGEGNATVVTSLSGGTVYSFPNVLYVGQGPQTVAPEITWSSTNDTSVLGFVGTYYFGDNGTWLSSIGAMAGLNNQAGTMTFAFGSPVSSVGGFLNYGLYGSTPTTIGVYDSSDNLIESYDLTFLTDKSNNSGRFYGFYESSPNISYFTLTDNYIGITDLTVNGNPVPEPSTIILIGLGLVGLAGLGRKGILK